MPTIFRWMIREDMLTQPSSPQPSPPEEDRERLRSTKPAAAQLWNTIQASAFARRHNLRLRVSAAGFLSALVLLLVASPFLREFRAGQIYEAVLYTLVLCTGLIASGSSRKTHAVVYALVSLALAAMWMNQIWPQKIMAVMSDLLGMAFLALVIVSLLGFILRSTRVEVNVLCAGISVYLILGLLWGLAYSLVAQIIPNAFAFTPPGPAVSMSGFTAMYFSFSTLATLGYGDIAPTANVARMLAMLEAMTGTLFIGVMIARLVSLCSTPAQKDAGPR
jgi:Ion channel